MAVDKSVAFAFANVAAAATDAVLVAANPTAKIRVLGAIVSPASATPPASVTFNSKSAGAGTAISPALGLIAGTPIPMSPDSAIGFFETKKGEGLTVTTGAGTNGVGVAVAFSYNYS